MGKFVTPVDVVAETAKVLKAVHKYLKTVTCNVDTVEHDRLLDNKICVIIDNDGTLAADIGSMLGKMKGVSIVDTLEVRGVYDWRADRYLRPCSSILIQFSNK